MKSGEFKREIETIKRQINGINDENIKNILDSRMLWYQKHSEYNKWAFRLCSLAVVAINAIIAVMSHLSGNLWMAVFPVVVIFINSAMVVFNMQDNWKRYRRTLEKLRSETDLYVNKAGEYAKCYNDDKCDCCTAEECRCCRDKKCNRLFVERVIQIADDENIKWASQQSKEKDETSPEEDK